MKPLEFKIEERKIDNEVFFGIVFYYEDGTTQKIEISDVPKGLELNKHYSIADIYGYQVKDDREGL